MKTLTSSLIGAGTRPSADTDDTDYAVAAGEQPEGSQRSAKREGVLAVLGPAGENASVSEARIENTYDLIAEPRE